MLSALITDVIYLSSAVMLSPEVKGTNPETALLARVVLLLVLQTASGCVPMCVVLLDLVCSLDLL
jgi:hypothetical protein